MGKRGFVRAAVFGLVVFAVIPSKAGPQTAAATGVCGGSAFCYDATNFTASVTTFRVSTNNVYKQKIIDVTVRFQNKTNQAVVLAYVDHSGLATDDRGNRSIPWGPNAYRGIGLVSGTTFDPKLVVRPGGWGDAQFELVQQGNPQVTGAAYMLDLTIDEINNSGGQPTFGGEIPIHFDGLVNGSAGSVPALAGLAGAPCAGQRTTSKAASAASTISNIGSLFGKKKTAQVAGQVAAATPGCDAAVNAATSARGNVGTIAASATSQPSTTAAAANGSESKANRSSGITANAAPAQASADMSGVSGQSAQPWTPPSDVAEEKTELKDPLALPVVAKMPDVVGVRLGMTEQQALQILHGQYPRDQFQEIPTGGSIPEYPKADYGFNVLPVGEIATDVVVSLTAPPSRQVVWHIVRFTRRLHANHANVLSTLREKYGKESFAGLANGSKTTDDRSIGTLFWIYDEQGKRAPMPAAQAFGSNDITFCLGRGISLNPGPRIPMDEVKEPNWCASFVGVVAQIDPTEIVENTTVAVMDLRLANRTANAYVAWKRNADAKARAAEIEKSKKTKPVF